MGMIVAEIKSRTKVHKEVMLLKGASAGGSPPLATANCSGNCMGLFLPHPDTYKSDPELL